MTSINIYDELTDDPEYHSPITDDNLSDDGESPEDGMQSVIDMELTPNIIYHDNTRENTTSTTSNPTTGARPIHRTDMEWII